MVLSNGFFYERIQLDTINERFNKVPTAKEGDANGRGMIVVLTENGLVKNTTGVSLLFKWEHTRITGAQGLEDFEPLDLTKGEYIVTYPTEMNHEGYVKAEIRIIDNGKYAGSRNMKIQVEPSVGDDTAIESSNEFRALVSALVEVNGWNDRIDAVEADFIQRANDVEATYPQKLNSLTYQLADIKQDVSLTVTVGTGGDYATVNEAIAALSQKKLKYSNTGFNATINLLTGFVMSEQIFVKNIDLGFITITSEDAEVIVNVTGFVNNVNELGYGATGLTLTTGAVITAYGNAVLPVIDVLFNLNSSGTLGRTFGLVLIYGATGRIARDKGFINGIAGGVAIYEGSRLYATDTIIRDNAGNNIACYRGSYILVRGSDVSGSGGYGVYLDNLCQMDAAMANFSNAAEAAIWASAGTVVSANSSNLSGSKIGVTADSSSVVDVHGSNIDNCTQTGVSCSGSLVDVRNSSILNSGGVAVSCTMGGTVNADTVDCTGATSYCLSATYGGTINARNAKAQKILGTNGLDIRILSGAIINANGATGGITGATANQLSGAGIVFTSAPAANDIGFVGTYTGRGHWFTNLGMSVSTTLPLQKPTLKNIVVTVVNILQSGNLTAEELALITIEKNSEGFSLITSDATLAAKMAGKNTKVTATVTAI